MTLESVPRRMTTTMKRCWVSLIQLHSDRQRWSWHSWEHTSQCSRLWRTDLSDTWSSPQLCAIHWWIQSKDPQNFNSRRSSRTFSLQDSYIFFCRFFADSQNIPKYSCKILPFEISHVSQRRIQWHSVHFTPSEERGRSWQRASSPHNKEEEEGYDTHKKREERSSANQKEGGKQDHQKGGVGDHAAPAKREEGESTTTQNKGGGSSPPTRRQQPPNWMMGTQHCQKRRGPQLYFNSFLRYST